ncbi:MAG: GspH/FimT family pseudopilin [Gammaproteobacteria bacterium]|nr:GspH/FimT family pseudopilin [Gammaproteobacteria bacterium]MBU1447274.1 GspH/FimT family pseudopilin [Gammaproteobacteria bacterium]
MLTPCDKSAQSGFSLIELMIGIAILAILASVAAPSFQVWLQNSQIRNAAESIVNGLQRARSEAVGRNTNMEFVLIGNDSSWVVRVAKGTVIEQRSSGEGSRNVTATPTPGTSNTVTYNSFGSILAINPVDGTAPFTRVDVDSAVLPAAESQELRITLGVGGNIRMCDPNVSPPNPRAC